jgi:2-dehydropantoate 2-reductase
LAYSGQEVHFLLHSDYQFVKECGMQVDSCDGSFHLDHVNVYQYAEDMPKCDVVIVGVENNEQSSVAFIAYTIAS